MSDEGSTGTTSGAGASDQTAAEQDAVALAAQVVKLQELLRDQNLRGIAEAENVRRRAARDVENAQKFALERFVAALVPLADSLERAVQTAEAATAVEAKAIGEGVSLSLRLFHDTLSKFGVEAIDPIGAPFDPQWHQAMTMVDNPEMEPGSVMQVMQKGYRLNGRLVRPAMVVVTKPRVSKIDERA